MRKGTVTMNARQEANSKKYEAYLRTLDDSALVQLADIIQKQRDFIKNEEMDAYDKSVFEANALFDGLNETLQKSILDWESQNLKVE